MKNFLLVLFLLPLFCEAQVPPIGNFKFTVVINEYYSPRYSKFFVTSKKTNQNINIFFYKDKIIIKDGTILSFKIIKKPTIESSEIDNTYYYNVIDQTGKKQQIHAVVMKDDEHATLVTCMFNTTLKGTDTEVTNFFPRE